MKRGRQCLDDFYSEVRGKTLKGGYITVIHTHGRNGQYHPHVHVLATSSRTREVRGGMGYQLNS